MSTAPIVLFVYNRPWHTQLTIQSLKENSLASISDLFIFCDGAKDDNAIPNVRKVRELVKKISGFRSITVYERQDNAGLAKSIIDGVSQVIKNYGKVIVLEDDLITSPNFLKFMNDALSYCRDDEKVSSVTGWSPPSISLLKNYHADIYFHPRSMSWSWATWLDRWESVDWKVEDYEEFRSNKFLIKKFNRGGQDLSRMLELQMRGKINSWYIRWCYHCFKKQTYTLYPFNSLVKNIGHDGSGVHCAVDESQKYSHEELSHKREWVFQNFFLDEGLIRQYNKVFNPTLKQRFKIFIKELIKK